jgi:hypothetical protein
MKPIVKAGLLLALAAGSTSAFAVPTNVNVFDGAANSIASNVFQFDWSSGSTGVAIGQGPFGSPLAVGNTFGFVYQSILVGFNNSSSLPIPTSGLNTAFEFTIAMSLTEQVTAVGATSVDFAPTGGIVQIYYDNFASGVQANPTSGVGFDDGIKVAQFSVTGGASSFSASTLTGGTKFDFNLTSLTDFVNSAYIQGILGAVADFHFTSSQNFPAQTFPVAFFANSGPDINLPTYTVDNTCGTLPTGANTCDLNLIVDGSNNFTTTVPEPTTMFLLATGLLGLGFNIRRMKA